MNSPDGELLKNNGQDGDLEGGALVRGAFLQMRSSQRADRESLHGGGLPLELLHRKRGGKKSVTSDMRTHDTLTVATRSLSVYRRVRVSHDSASTKNLVPWGEQLFVLRDGKVTLARAYEARARLCLLLGRGARLPTAPVDPLSRRRASPYGTGRRKKKETRVVYLVARKSTIQVTT